jgi:energy-coupling factor transporter ATP-binding protein EcfA2
MEKPRAASRVKDLIEVAAIDGRRLAGREGASGVLSTFLVSYDVGDVLTRIIERLTADAEGGPGNCLIVGGPGCGKSTLLSVAVALLEAESTEGLHQRLAKLRAAVPNRILGVRISAGAGDTPLVVALEQALTRRLEAAGLPVPGGHAGQTRGHHLDVVAEAAAALPPGHQLLFVIDDLDAWACAAEPLATENLEVVSQLGKLAHGLPVTTCAVAREDALGVNAGPGYSQQCLTALVRDFRIEYVPSHAVRAATASHVLRKNARQRREILKILNELRRKLPELAYRDEEFVELYPLEVSTWTIGGHLHRWIDGFSFPEFAARAADSVKGRPAQSLFALHDMFKLYEPQLRLIDSLVPIFAAYDRVVAEAIPSLGHAQRLWARLVLQSIFMHTIAGIAADVKTLTNSVLLYDLHGGGSSYALMTAVLRQLEALGRGQFIASGEGLECRYSLVSGEREALQASIDEIAAGIADNDEKLAWELLHFGGHHFADWPFGASALDAARPDLWEIERGAGLVSLTTRAPGGNGGAGMNGDDGLPQPRLVVFLPGRPWSDARGEAARDHSAVCWIGQAPNPAERRVLKQWLAVTDLAKTSRGKRFTDLDEFRHELEAKAAAAFRRVYIESGVLVTAERSDAMTELVHESRDENLVVRLLSAVTATEPVPPAAPVEKTAEDAREQGEEPDEGTLWLAHLTAEGRENVQSAAACRDPEIWLRRVQTWYGARVGRDVIVSVRLLGERGAELPVVADGLDAGRQFDVALYYVRRALSVGNLQELGQEVRDVFRTPDRLWEARERLGWLERFAEWAPVFEMANRYVREAEPVTDGELEGLKYTLLDWLDRPDRFVEEPRRAIFMDAFETFRAKYTEYYTEQHDRSVGPAVIQRLNKALVESGPWHTLEALSALSIANPSYLIDAINLLSVLCDAVCEAPVGAALEERPTCVCGYRLADRDRVREMASSASEFIETGVEYHRQLLHARQAELREKLETDEAANDSETVRAIAHLTEEGPLPALDRHTIDILNELLTE